MGGSLVGSQLVLVMDLPAPPTIHGVDTISSSYSSGASHGFFNSLFDFYSSISTKHNTRRFPGNDLQKEIHAIKSVRAMAFSGIRLDLVRNVSRHFQMKHTMQFVSKSIPSPRYVNITQFDSDFKQLSARLWNSVAMSAQFVPVAGVIKGNLISSTVLTREPNAKKPDRNANTLTTSVRVKSHSDREKSKEEPFLESLGVELAMPGSSLGVHHEAGDSTQLMFVQQLSRRNFASLTMYLCPGDVVVAGLQSVFRHERPWEAPNKPRDIWTVMANVNNMSLLAQLGLGYSRRFNKNFQASTEIEMVPSRETGQPELKTWTGLEYMYSSYAVQSSLKCLVNNKGELSCVFEDALNHITSYSLSAQLNLLENDFSFGFGFTLNMDQ